MKKGSATSRDFSHKEAAFNRMVYREQKKQRQLENEAWRDWK